MSYGLNDSQCNKFLGRSWRHISTNSTEPLGVMVLKSRGVFPEAHCYWIGVVALFGFILLSLDKPHAVLSKEASAKKQATETGEAVELLSTGKSYIGAANERLDNVLVNLTDQRGMVLPFEPLSVTSDKIRYAVDMPYCLCTQLDQFRSGLPSV
ncbi:hypothetical protein ABKV19_002550 [Rosa sericea]